MNRLYALAILVVLVPLASCGAGVDEATISFDSDPPGDVATFTATAGTGEIQLDWINPTDADFSGVQIVRSTGSAPAAPDEGAQVFNGNGTSFLDSGLTAGTEYFYTAFAFDDLANFSAGVSASATPN